MDKITLVAPDATHEAQALAYLREHSAAGETGLHGSGGLDFIPVYADWLLFLDRGSRPETVAPGRVPASTYFAVREADGQIVGMIDIRHTLNDALRLHGGHIGYGVRPSQRRKGYATQMLRAALPLCRDLGLSRVMLACDAQNEASRRTILACGGVLSHSVPHTDTGNPNEVYWITL